MPEVVPTKVVGRRTAAFILDWLLVSVIGSLFFLLLAEKRPIGPHGASGFHFNSGADYYAVEGNRALIYVVLNLIVLIGIAVVLEGRTGATPGKALLGLRVVNREGAPPGLGRAAARLSGWVVDGFPYFPWGLTGLIVSLASKGNRRVGDMMGDTFVVRVADAGVPVALTEQPHPVSTVAIPAPGRDAFGNVVPGAETAPVTAAFGTAAAQSQPAAPPPNAAADWYPDPTGAKRLRYWDGAVWTSHTAD